MAKAIPNTSSSSSGSATTQNTVSIAQANNVPINRIKTWIQTSKTARRDYENDWDKNKEYYEGNQWNGITNIAWFQSSPVFNKIFEFITTMRAYNSDNNWGIDCIPIAVPDDQNSDAIMEQSVKVKQLLDFLWLQNHMQLKLAEVLHYVFMYGTGFIKVTFDPDDISNSGIGQVSTEVLSPRYIFPDPYATCVQDADFIIELHSQSYRWAIDHYPELQQQIVNSGEQARSTYEEGRAGLPAGAPNISRGQALDIYEVWYKDSTMLETEGGTSNDPEDAQKKYPTGRHTVVTEGGLVLEDGECLYSSWPYVRFLEIARPGEFFGDCTVSKVRPIQDNINQILRSIIDNGLWLVHGLWIADTTSGVTPKSLAGYGPRDTIMKHPGTEVKRDSGAQLPAHLFQMLDEQVQAFDIVSGFPNVLRGEVPSRQPVQTVMMQKESGEVRVRERQRRVEDSLVDLGKSFIDIVANHWTDKRNISSKTAIGSFNMFEISSKDFDQWEWDIQVIPGSTGPFDKTAMLQTLKEAKHDVGIPIPDTFFVRMMGIPGLEAAMNEQQQAAEQMQQQQNAGPPNGGQSPMGPGPQNGPPIGPPVAQAQPMPPVGIVPQPPIGPMPQGGGVPQLPPQVLAALQQGGGVPQP